MFTKARISINFESLFICIFRLTKEESLKDSFKKFREMQQENEELSTKLTKKERECLSKAEEKVL